MIGDRPVSARELINNEPHLGVFLINSRIEIPVNEVFKMGSARYVCRAYTKKDMFKCRDCILKLISRCAPFTCSDSRLDGIDVHFKLVSNNPFVNTDIEEATIIGSTDTNMFKRLIRKLCIGMRSFFKR